MVRLKIRLDEGADVKAVLSRLEPDGGSTKAAGMVNRNAALTDTSLALSQQQGSYQALGSARQYLSPEELQASLSQLNAERAALDGTLDITLTALRDLDDQPIELALPPLTVKLERNGIHDADTCSMTFAFGDLPVDPRVVRSAFVEVDVGAVSGDEFSAGIAGARADGGLFSVLPVGSDSELRASTRFVGFVDEWRVSAGDDGDRVELTARDLTSELMGKRLPSGVRIDLGVPIADGIQELIDRYPQTRGLRVVFGEPTRDPSMDGDRGPVPADLIGNARRARRGKRASRARQGAKDLSLWDHITDTVVALGYVPVLRNYFLFIANARTMFTTEEQGVRRLAYGRNLLSLELSRKLSSDAASATVEVRCPDPQRGRTLWARAPKVEGAPGPWSGAYGESDPPRAPARASKVTPGGSTAEEVRVFVVHGIGDLETLERAATSIFEQYGRNEIDGTFVTHDLSSLERDDEDLLDLQPSDPVHVYVAALNDSTTGDPTNRAPGGSANSLQSLATASEALRRDYLERIGVPRQKAQQLAESSRISALVSTFRVSTATVEFDVSSGVQITGDFVNFFVVRQEAGQVAQQGPGALASALSGGRGSDAARALRGSGAEINTLASAAQAGALSADDYAQQGSDAVLGGSVAAAAVRGGGG